MTRETCWLGVASAAAIALSFALSIGSAGAAPIGSAVDALRADPATPGAETVAYRRCWWRHGVRHCRWYDGYGYNGYYGYGPPRAEDYRTGSGRWWRQMDREGRGGRGS